MGFGSYLSPCAICMVFNFILSKYFLGAAYDPKDYQAYLSSHPICYYCTKVHDFERCTKYQIGLSQLNKIPKQITTVMLVVIYLFP